MKREDAGEVPDFDPPKTLAEIVARCDECLKFVKSDIANMLGRPADVIEQLVMRIRQALQSLPKWPPLPPELTKPPRVRRVAAGGITENSPMICPVDNAVPEYLRTVRDWALVQLAGSVSTVRADVVADALSEEGTKFSEKDVPATFREGGKPDGKPLTVKYLEKNVIWLLKGPYIHNNFGSGKILTRYIRVGLAGARPGDRRRTARAYLFKELLVLREKRDRSEPDE
jgi:hypothetical protein